MHMFREHQNNWSQAFQASRNHTKDGRDNVGMTCKKWTVWKFFLPSIWHAASVYMIGITNMVSISVFFFKPLWTRFWNKTPQKGERNAFLSPSSTKGITSVRFAIKEKEPPSRHVGFVYLFPELLRRAGLCGYFFKEVWGKCTWFLDLSNITQILGAPGASLLNFSF